MEFSIDLDGQIIPYRIRCSDRSRRVSLRFTDRGLEVVRPARLRSPFVAEPLLRRFSTWIRRQADRHANLSARRRETEGRILLRGQDLGLDFQRQDGLPSTGRVTLAEGRLLVESAPGREPSAALRAWLFDEARRDLAAAMARRSAEMEQPFGRMSVRDQRWLWGSCSPASGTVSLNARLVMAPPEVLDYIVVHELAHFRWRGHGKRFWLRVAEFCPGHQAHRRWLRENAWRLRLVTLDNGDS